MAVSNIVLNIITKGADLAKRQLDGIGKTGDKSSKGLGKFGKAMGTTVVAGAVAMGKALQLATKQFIEFDDAMTQSLAIMQATEDQQRRMEQTARDVALTTTFSATQTAESFFFLASAGLDAEQQIQALPQVAKFAQAGMFDMATATDLATDAQSALGLTVSDAQQNLENLTRVTDVLVKANTLANASVQQFSEALTSKAGSALKVVNKDIEEGVAVLAVFADAGVKGAEGGEKLNQVLRDIPRATAKNGEEFRKLGLEMFDAEGNMKNVADIVEELDRVLKPMSDELKASTLDQLGLNRGVADAVKILSGSTDKIRDYESALRDSRGVTGDIAENQLESLQSQLTLAKDKFIEVGLSIVEKYNPAMQDAIGATNAFLDILLGRVPDVDDFAFGFDKLIRFLEILNPRFRTNISAVKILTDVQEDLNDQLRIDAYQEFAEGVRKATKEQEFKALVDKDAINNAHRYEIETMNTTSAIQAQTDATVELTEEEIALNKERNEKGLGALRKVQSAYQKIEDIQQNIVDLTTELQDAEDALEDAHTKNAQAIGTVEEMERRLSEEKANSTIVTAQEELAIIKQRQAVQDLTDAQDGSREKELELQLAKEELTKRIEESTGATREEDQAQRDLDRAKADAIKTEEKLDKAKETARKATEDLAKATDDSTENMLEMAIAKKELDQALADANALGSFEDLVGLMADSVEGDLQRVIDKFNEIAGIGGTKVTTGGNIATSNTFSPAGALDNTGSGSGSSSGGIGGFAGSMLASSGAVNINVTTGAVLGTEKAVEDAVTVALEKAKQRGLGIS
jgi:TP901 family phage tail tape measure protein